MQIQISSRDLLRGINAVAKVINSKNAMPLLGTVLVSSNGSDVYALTASDGENELTCDINLVVLEGTFQPFCVDPRLLQSTLSTLGDQPLTLTVTQSGDNVKVDVRYLNGQFSVPGFVATEYPRIRTAEAVIAHIDADAPLLLQCMQSAVLCTATDELRPVMNAVALDVTSSDRNSPMPEEVVIVGSDGHTLYKNIISQGEALTMKKIDGKAVLLVPRHIIATLINAFKGSERIEVKALGSTVNNEQLTVNNGTIHNIVFTAPGVEFITRAIEGRYPNYNSVIPTNQKYAASFNVKALAQSVKRVSPFASDASNLIALRRKGFETILSCEDIDFSTSANESIDCADCTLPDNYAIGMKSTTLLQHLGMINTDNVRFLLDDPNRALVMKNDDPNSTLTLLLMPMLLQ